MGLVTGGKEDPQDPRWRPTDHAFYGERARDVYDGLPKWCVSDPEGASFPTCPCPISDYTSAHSFSVLDGQSSLPPLCSNRRMHVSPSGTSLAGISDVSAQKWD